MSATDRERHWRKPQLGKNCSSSQVPCEKSGLVLGRVQSAGAGAELQVGLALHRLRTVPHTSAARDALLAIEIGRPFHAPGNGLPGTHLHAKLASAAAADFNVAEDDVVGISRRSLDLAPH